MLYSFVELEGIQMMHACVRNSWMGAPYWQKNKQKQKKHCQVTVTGVSVQCTIILIF